jgi:condensin-2 complex subunit H2
VLTSFFARSILSFQTPVSSDESLEEYLQECIAEFPVSVQEQHDKTSSSLNFAQAALVVQNSSHIYGRKVEFLYSLTYKTLEELSAQGANPAAKRKSAEDPDIDEFFNYDPHQEFLLLNDVLPTDESPEGRKINLAPARGDNGRRSSLSSRGRRSMTPRSRTLHSGLAEQRTRNVSSFYAAALAGDADGKGSSLRLMDCELGQDGCLLMPEVADFTRKRESLADELVFSETGHVQNGEGNAEGVTPNEDVGGYGGGSFPDDDDDDGGGGFEFAHDTAPMDVSEPPQGDSPGGTREPMKRVTFADEAKPPPEDDPWELLDPYVPDTTKPRPLRIGRTIVLPAGLEELPSECIAGAPRRRVPRQAPQQPLPWSRSLVTETFRATLANSRKRRNAEMDKDWDDPAERPVLPLKGLAYGDEFAYIAKEAARRKRAELREKRKQRMAAAVSGSSGETAKNDDNAVCDEGGFDYGGDDDDGFDYGDGGAAFGDNDEGPILTNTGMVEVGEVYQNIGVHRGTFFCIMFLSVTILVCPKDL